MDDWVTVMTLDEAIGRCESMLSRPYASNLNAQQRMDYKQLLDWLEELSYYRKVFKNLEDDGK